MVLPLEGECLLAQLCHGPLLPLRVLVINMTCRLLLCICSRAHPLYLLLSLSIEDFLLDDLLATLVRNGRLLLIIEVLIVAWLDTVRGQHRLLGGRAVGNEIIGKNDIHLMCLLVIPILPLSQLGILFLLGWLQVVLVSGTEHVGVSDEKPMSPSVCIEVDSLLIVGPTSTIVNSHHHRHLQLKKP